MTRWLIVLSVVLTPGVNWLLSSLFLLAQNVQCIGAVLKYLTANGVIFAVSYIGLFSALNAIWGQLLWKIPFVAKWHQIPNLNGTWTGKLHSNYDGLRDLDMKMQIEQTWTEIDCTSFFAESSSSSQMARVYIRNDEEARLEFAYGNESTNSDVVQREYHGYNWFTVRGDKMKGCYFTDRVGADNSSKTAGSMDLKKERASCKKKKKVNSTIRV